MSIDVSSHPSDVVSVGARLSNIAIHVDLRSHIIVLNVLSIVACLLLHSNRIIWQVHNGNVSSTLVLIDVDEGVALVSILIE
jgi:hypothetical protein